MDDYTIRKSVREGYANIARKGTSSKGGCCCGSEKTATFISKSIGYTDEDMRKAPEESNLGLGCGNPIAHASLKEGETVLDLGSGAGFDCFLAAGHVGKTGRVIGVDMTPEMIEKARANARKGAYENVEFRLGEIEHLPVADNSIDIIISNCVINLSPQKDSVFRDACRVLKPGGRLLVSDIVLDRELPVALRESVSAYIGCISGASMREEYLGAIRRAGFMDVRIVEESRFSLDCMVNDLTAEIFPAGLNISPEMLMQMRDTLASIKVAAYKNIFYCFRKNFAIYSICM